MNFNEFPVVITWIHTITHIFHFCKRITCVFPMDRPDPLLFFNYDHIGSKNEKGIEHLLLLVWRARHLRNDIGSVSFENLFDRMTSF
jgi:hypothetical protein